ncbi:MAG: TilS substrate-binding domain-containing protein, partial [Nostoc sp.]
MLSGIGHGALGMGHGALVLSEAVGVASRREVLGMGHEEDFLIPLLPLRLNRRVLEKAPLALQRRVMRQVLQQILSDAPSFEHIEKLTVLIIAPNRSQTDPFPGGAIAQVEGDWICLK